MNQKVQLKIKPPSEETKRKMVEFFMKTSIPRILAALERGELVLENGNLLRLKEMTNGENRVLQKHGYSSIGER